MELLKEKIATEKKQTIEYITQREPDSFGLTVVVIDEETAEEILDTIEPNGDRENTIREQAYLKGLQDALLLISNETKN
jgi:hypothetical protein